MTNSNKSANKSASLRSSVVANFTAAFKRLMEEDFPSFNENVHLVFRAGFSTYTKDFKIEVQLTTSEYAEGVKGKDFNEVLKEFKRRHGWQEAHKATEVPLLSITNQQSSQQSEKGEGEEEGDTIDYTSITHNIVDLKAP